MKDNLLIQEVADFLDIDISHFDNINITTQTGTGQDLSVEMKTFYDNALIENAKAKLIHDQFAQTRDIPKNNGKIIEFRRYAPFAKALTALTEGTTPAGQKLSVSNLTATVKQYGGYIELADMLIMTAFDDNIAAATKGMAQQAGDTLDTITREVINAGTNVQYANAQVAARYLLVGGDATAANNHYLSVDGVRRAVRTLKVGKAQAIAGGNYVAIIHSDTAYDIMGDTGWVNASLYAGSDQIFQGEIGRIHGARFVETTEAKVFNAPNLSATRNLTCASNTGKIFTIAEALTTAQAAAMVGRKIIVKAVLYTVGASAAGSAGAATVTVVESITGSPTTDVMYPGESGAAGRDVYSTLFIGADAYGTTKVSGGGLQTFVKQLGSAGSADPIDQRATVGWKAVKTAVILTQDFMIRVETASTFQAGAN